MRRAGSMVYLPGELLITLYFAGILSHRDGVSVARFQTLEMLAHCMISRSGRKARMLWM
jgi:hypothetical protein